MIKFVCLLCKLLTVGECYGPLCNKLITIVNYYLEIGLSLLFIESKASYHFIAIVRLPLLLKLDIVIITIEIESRLYCFWLNVKLDCTPIRCV